MQLDEVTVVIVPGLRDHVADHWQTLLAAALPRSVIVPPLERDKLSRAARVDALARTLDAVQGPLLLVAHSAGVITVAHWALVEARARALGQGRRHAIRGALLATPADLEQPLPAGYPTQETLRDHGWLPIPRMPLPFPAVVAMSRNDPLGQPARVQTFASDWQTECVDIGDAGHLNPASGHGEWPLALELIQTLLTDPVPA